MRKGNGSELPLPLWERGGVRGYGLTTDRNPSPGSHLAMRSDLSRKGRGEGSPPNQFNQKLSQAGRNSPDLPFPEWIATIPALCHLKANKAVMGERCANP